MSITDKRKLTTQEDYSKISKMYATDFGKDHDHFDYIDLVIKQLSENQLEDYPVIDLGAGSGVVTDYLIEKGVKSVIALDLTPDFCNMITKNHQNNVTVICDDMVEFLKKEKVESVSALISNYSIVHVPDEEIESFFADIHRSLTKNGLFLMSCHKGTFKGMEQEPYQTQNDSRLDVESELSTYMNYFTEDELKQRIQKAGLTVIKLETFETKIVPGEIPVPKIWLLAQKQD